MTIKILLDPGHGAGKAHNRGFRGGDNEGDVNYNYCVGHLKPALEKVGFVVEMTRKKITDDPSLAQRGAMGAGFDLLFSSHSNAMPKPNTGTGTEIFDSVQKPTGSLAGTLSAEIAKTIGIANRGRKTRKDSDGTDWYGVLRNSKAKSAMLVEHFFHDNDKDVAKWWKTYKQVAERTAQVLATHYGLNKPKTPSKPKTSGMPIMGKPSVTIGQMRAWAKANKADAIFIDLAPMFYDESVAVNIDPAIVYAQSAKETAFMRFGGVLDESFKNPCGMKTTQGGGNYDKNAHKRFSSWRDGIRAHVDHLALYAGHKDYPRKDTPDPRHFVSIAGTAPTVEQLGTRWAPSTTYGKDIVSMVLKLRATKSEGEYVIPSPVDRNPTENKTPSPVDRNPTENTTPTSEKRYIGVFASSVADTGNAIRITQLVPHCVFIDVSHLDADMYRDIVQVGGSKHSKTTVHLTGANRYETDKEVTKWINQNM